MKTPKEHIRQFQPAIVIKSERQLRYERRNQKTWAKEFNYEVEAKSKLDGKWYKCEILHTNRNCTYNIRFLDGEIQQ